MVALVFVNSTDFTSTEQWNQATFNSFNSKKHKIKIINYSSMLSGIEDNNSVETSYQQMVNQ
jgi:hypothetical protein